MDAESVETALGVDVAVDGVGGEDVGAVGIGVAEEVGEGYGWEGVVVCEG